MASLAISTMERGADFRLHVILDHTVDGRRAAIDALEDDIETAEEGMLEDAATFRLGDLVHLRRASLSRRRSVLHTGLTETYLSPVNNRMADVANRMSRGGRGLTLITTVFMPLTLLAGIGGMPGRSTMTGLHEWRVALPLFMPGMAWIGCVSYVLLRRIEGTRGDRQGDGS